MLRRRLHTKRDWPLSRAVMLAPSDLLRMRFKGRPLEVPHRLRAIVRARESSIILLAAAVGLVAGLVVAAMSEAVGLMHLVFFGLDPGERLSTQTKNKPHNTNLTPCLGGLVFGLVSAY